MKRSVEELFARVLVEGPDHQDRLTAAMMARMTPEELRVLGTLWRIGDRLAKLDPTRKAIEQERQTLLAERTRLERTIEQQRMDIESFRAWAAFSSALQQALPPRPRQCFTNYIGTTAYTNCY